MTRRELLVGGVAAGAAVAGLSAASSQKVVAGAGGKMPALFLAHGAPMLLDMPEWVSELKSWADALPRPRSILMVSAHWEARPMALGATRTVPLIYDFYGFPAHHYRQQYPAPGAPELAGQVRALLQGRALADEPERGLDHGAYVPLVAMYPAADVPVLQLSLPSLEAKELYEVGRALAPLRDEGVLVVGSGFLTHNLGRVDWSASPRTPAWAAEFDQWAKAALERGDVDTLLDFQAKAPACRLALPTTEHFVPLLVALGAAGGASTTNFPITGFFGGTLTRRSVQLG